MIAVCGGVCSVPLYPQTFFSPPPTDQNLPTNGSTRQSSFFFTAIVSVMTRSFDGGCDQFNSFFASEKKGFTRQSNSDWKPGERERGREGEGRRERTPRPNKPAKPTGHWDSPPPNPRSSAQNVEHQRRSRTRGKKAVCHPRRDRTDQTWDRDARGARNQSKQKRPAGYRQAEGQRTQT